MLAFSTQLFGGHATALEELSCHWAMVWSFLQLLGPNKGYGREPALPGFMKANQTPRNRRDFPLPVTWIARTRPCVLPYRFRNFCLFVIRCFLSSAL